ncbi:lipoyl(octanoyl) transferase [Spizellomyces sp. 'palustris']|nr:lipoyl(octanoyl) transferase [Spizellomyces sp. 'palustris']
MLLGRSQRRSKTCLVVLLLQLLCLTITVYGWSLKHPLSLVVRLHQNGSGAKQASHALLRRASTVAISETQQSITPTKVTAENIERSVTTTSPSTEALSTPSATVIPSSTTSQSSSAPSTESSPSPIVTNPPHTESGSPTASHSPEPTSSIDGGPSPSLSASAAETTPTITTQRHWRPPEALFKGAEHPEGDPSGGTQRGSQNGPPGSGDGTVGIPAPGGPGSGPSGSSPFADDGNQSGQSSSVTRIAVGLLVSGFIAAAVIGGFLQRQRRRGSDPESKIHPSLDGDTAAMGGPKPLNLEAAFTAPAFLDSTSTVTSGTTLGMNSVTSTVRGIPTPTPLPKAPFPQTRSNTNRLAVFALKHLNVNLPQLLTSSAAKKPTLPAILLSKPPPLASLALPHIRTKERDKDIDAEDFLMPMRTRSLGSVSEYLHSDNDTMSSSGTLHSDNDTLSSGGTLHSDPTLASLRRMSLPEDATHLPDLLVLCQHGDTIVLARRVRRQTVLDEGHNLEEVIPAQRVYRDT